MEEQERRLVLIEWVDSYGVSATWQNLSNCEPELMVCQSVGWLVHDDERCKVIVPHISQPDHPTTSQQGCGDMTIPSSAILRIADLSIVMPTADQENA